MLKGIYQPKLQRQLEYQAYRILRDQALAEDAVQAAFEVGLQSRTEQFRNPIAWFSRVVSHHSYRELRRRKFASHLSHGISDTEFNDDPSLQVAREEELSRLRQELSRLPHPYGAALVLRYWEQLSHRQIGERLGGSEVAAAKWVQRGRERLRCCLAISA